VNVVTGWFQCRRERHVPEVEIRSPFTTTVVTRCRRCRRYIEVEVAGIASNPVRGPGEPPSGEGH